MEKMRGKKCIKFYLLILKRRQLVGDLDIDGNMNWTVSLMWYEGGFVPSWDKVHLWAVVYIIMGEI